MKLIARFLVVLFLLAMVQPKPAAAQTCTPFTPIYVDADATGNHDGTSWANAYPYLRDATDFVGSCMASNQEIWVAAGVYYANDNYADHTNTLRDKTFHLYSGVQMYGGFDPSTGDDTFAERDWVANPTVLSGDSFKDNSDPDGDHLYESWSDIGTGNAFHVVTIAYIAATTRLDGFSITSGNADTEDYGGGIDAATDYVSRNGLTLANLDIVGNQGSWGAGMALRGSGNVTFTNVKFEWNRAFSFDAGGGGRLASSLQGGGSGINTIVGGEGGGLWIYGWNNFSTLDNVTFDQNKAGVSGGALFLGYKASPTLTHVSFTNNVSTGNGGAVYLSYENVLTVTDGIFTGNTAYDGTAFFFDISPNNVSATGTLTNVLIAGNHSTYTYGGAIYNYNSYETLVNATIVNNDGVGIYNRGSLSTPTLQNSIIWGHSWRSIYNYSSSTTTLQNSLAGGCNPGGVWNASLCGTDGGGNMVDADPLLDSNYQLQKGSPAIDVGDNSLNATNLDLAGKTRIVNRVIDLGANEQQTLFCPADGMLYVKANTTGGQTGLSWTDAYKYLGDALKVGEACQVWVAKGVYYPDEGYRIMDGDEYSTFLLPPNVEIYGGFNGSETSLSSADWKTNKSILSGDLDKDDTNTDSNNIAETWNDIVGPAAHHVVTASDASGSRLDGFYITGGYATGSLTGGGMYAISNGVTLANLVFSGNKTDESGGGLYAKADTFSMDKLTFTGNQSIKNGGGATIQTNTATTLSALSFLGNHAGFNGGGLMIYQANLSLANSLFSGNKADYYGGGIYNTTSSGSLTNVTFASNLAMYGGGLANNHSSPVVKNAIFWGNDGTSSDDQVYNNNSTPAYYKTDMQGQFLGGDNFNTQPDPVFISPLLASAAPTSAGDYRIKPTSPLVDTGENSYNTTSRDLDNQRRIMNGTIDVGAYENYVLEVRASKMAAPGSVPETGGTVQFTYTVDNPNLEWIQITSLADDRFSISGGTDCREGTSIQPGGRCSFMYSTTLSGKANTYHTNTFTVKVRDENNAFSTATKTATANVFFTDVKPQITVTKTADPTSVPETGGSVTFTYEVENSGLVEATISALTDDIFGTLSGLDLCEVGTNLEPGYRCNFTYTTTLSGDPETPHVNTFSAKLKDLENNEVTGTASATVTFTDVPRTPQTITFAALPDKNYGESPFTVSASTSSGLDVSFGASGKCSVANSSGWTVTLTGAGSCTITASQDGDATYEPATPVAHTFTINTLSLTITASSRGKTYGQTVTFTGSEFTTSGLLSGDSVTSVTLTSAGADATASATTYNIVPSAALGSGLDNYTVGYTNGTLTVSQKTLTITANSRSKTYGQTVTFAGAEFTPSGLTNSDTVTSVTLTSAGAPATAGVTTYSIVPSSASGSGLGNYSIGYTNGTLTVDPKTLTITANSRSKTYGQTVTFAGTEFTPAGLTNSDTVTSVTLTSAGAAATAAATTYSIVPSAASGTGLGNYSVGYSNGTLTVDPKTLTITANSRSKTYGQTVTFAGTEFTPSGLTNSDTVTSVTLTSAGAAATAAATTYSIVPSAASGLGLGNYSIGYTNGTLTVDPKGLTIAANNRVKTYGQTVTFSGTEFTPSGLTNSDTVTSVTLASAGAPASAGVNTYPIIPSAASGSGLGNYSIGYTNGTLTVNPATATVTLGSLTQTYDGTPRQATATTNPSGLAVTFTYAGFSTAPTNYGTYAVVGAVNDPNYTGTNSGTLNIQLRPITITADAKTKEYLQPDPALTFQVTSGSLASGDSFTGNLTRDAGEEPGSYPIRKGSVSAGSNYNLTYSGASLEITIIKSETSLALGASPTNIIAGQPVTLTAVVTPGTPNYGVPAGTVTFRQGPTTLGTAPLVGRTATLTSTAILGGPTPVSATYNGSAYYRTSTAANSQTMIVKFRFTGYGRWIDKPGSGMMNYATAGQAIPIKWMITDFNNKPVTNLTYVHVHMIPYSMLTYTITGPEVDATPLGSLQNLGNGIYQWVWQTSPSFAYSMKALKVDLGEGAGNEHKTFFTFLR